MLCQQVINNAGEVKAFNDLKHKNMFLNYNLKYMNDRGEMTFISQDMVGQEEGHQEVSCQSHQSHDWCWSASEVHWIRTS